MICSRDEIHAYVREAVAAYALRAEAPSIADAADWFADQLVDQPFWQVAAFVGTLREIETQDMQATAARDAFNECAVSICAEIFGVMDGYDAN